MLAQPHSGMRPCKPLLAYLQVVAQFVQAPARCGLHALAREREAAQPLRAVRHDALGSTRGRRRAFVRDEVGNREVHLVAYAAHDGNRAGEDGACDRLVVEGPQVLERAAAARDDQHVAVPARGREAQGLLDLARRGFALHGDRVDQHRDRREAPAQDVQYVAQRRAGRRGDDADPSRQSRQRLLVAAVEEPFGAESRLEFLETSPQQAFPRFLEVLDDDLEFAPRLVEADPAARENVRSVLARGSAPAGCAAGTSRSGPGPPRP